MRESGERVGYMCECRNQSDTPVNEWSVISRRSVGSNTEVVDRVSEVEMSSSWRVQSGGFRVEGSE